MRYSLGTLVLVVLWLGAMALVWIQRNPWAQVEPIDGVFYRATEFTPSPKQSRRIEIRHADEHPDCVTIVVNTGSDDGRVLWEKEGNFAHAVFYDDDTLELYDYEKKVLYHRHFPEWWWGHFYRPEVWLAILLSGALIWKAFTRAARFFASRRGAFPSPNRSA